MQSKLRRLLDQHMKDRDSYDRAEDFVDSHDHDNAQVDSRNCTENGVDSHHSDKALVDSHDRA